MDRDRQSQMNLRKWVLALCKSREKQVTSHLLVYSMPLNMYHNRLPEVLYMLLVMAKMTRSIYSLYCAASNMNKRRTVLLQKGGMILFIKGKQYTCTLVWMAMNAPCANLSHTVTLFI